MEQCSGCRFFEQVSDKGGRCRRYPPQITGEWIPEGLGKRVDDVRFPWVKHGWWCGEFKGVGQR